MNRFEVFVNSTVDVPPAWLEERDVKVIPLQYTIDGESYIDMQGLAPAEFFARLRNGSVSQTTQVTPQEAEEKLRPAVEAGKDVLVLTFSSAMSGTCDSINIAAGILKDEFPNAKINVVDTLCACMGEAILLYYVLKIRDAGGSLEEATNWAEANKLRVCHFVTVNDLHFLHRGGRISKAAAVLGSALQIKPIIYVDPEGRLQVIGKERGRKKSLANIVSRLKAHAAETENEIFMITHGDCIEDAEYTARLLEKELGATNILINNIGTVIGSHTGPGVVAVFGMGTNR